MTLDLLSCKVPTQSTADPGPSDPGRGMQEEQFGAELASAHHFLSLGTCLAGLQQLLQQLFGLAMQPQVPQPRVQGLGFRLLQPL